MRLHYSEPFILANIYDIFSTMNSVDSKLLEIWGNLQLGSHPPPSILAEGVRVLEARTVLMY